MQTRRRPWGAPPRTQFLPTQPRARPHPLPGSWHARACHKSQPAGHPPGSRLYQGRHRCERWDPAAGGTPQSRTAGGLVEIKTRGAGWLASGPPAVGPGCRPSNWNLPTCPDAPTGGGAGATRQRPDVQRRPPGLQGQPATRSLPNPAHPPRMAVATSFATFTPSPMWPLESPTHTKACRQGRASGIGSGVGRQTGGQCGD